MRFQGPATIVVALGLLLILMDLFWPRNLPAMPEQRETDWSNLWSNFHQHEPSWKLWSYRAEVYRTLMGMKALRPGHYPFVGQTSTIHWLRTMNAGRQTPVRLVIGKFRTIRQLSAFLARKLQADSLQWTELFLDSLRLDSQRLKAEWNIALFVPNTYEVYWTIEPKALQQRMLREYKAFWNPMRLAKADRLNMSPLEVITLASIVEEETQYKPERPTIAGVYLNRLRIQMPLQADPTLKFAAGDFGLRRIGRKQITISSPYNTYRVRGLPPGPICTPSVDAIDAVLHNEVHQFLYFCADSSKPGAHRFARSWHEHRQNAQAYHQWLNRRGIH